MNMRSAMASVKAHARNEQTRKTVEDVINKLAADPWKSVRVTTLIAQWVLLRHPTMLAQGIMYSTQVRNVGAGIKEVYLKQMKV